MNSKEAKKRMKNFSSSDKCPICKKKFKSNICPHSVTEAKERLFEDYVKSIKCG